jgi:hypothetical protein
VAHGLSFSSAIDTILIAPGMFAFASICNTSARNKTHVKLGNFKLIFPLAFENIITFITSWSKQIFDL